MAVAMHKLLLILHAVLQNQVPRQPRPAIASSRVSVVDERVPVRRCRLLVAVIVTH